MLFEKHFIKKQKHNFSLKSQRPGRIQCIDFQSSCKDSIISRIQGKQLNILKKEKLSMEFLRVSFCSNRII